MSIKYLLVWLWVSLDLHPASAQRQTPHCGPEGRHNVKGQCTDESLKIFPYDQIFGGGDHLLLKALRGEEEVV